MRHFCVNCVSSESVHTKTVSAENFAKLKTRNRPQSRCQMLHTVTTEIVFNSTRDAHKFALHPDSMHCPAWDHVMHPEYVDDDDALLSCCVQLPLDSLGFCLMCAEVIHKRDIAIDSESARRQDPASMHCPAWDHVLHAEYVDDDHDDDNDALLSCCVQLPLDSLGFCLMCAVYQANRLTDSSTDCVVRLAISLNTNPESVSILLFTSFWHTCRTDYNDMIM